MKIFWGIQHVTTLPAPVIAIGVFDGFHRGHQSLIQKTIREARRIKGTAVVMTFDPHPVQVLHPENRLPLINSLKHRLQLLADAGVDAVVVVKFTKAFSRMSPDAFISRYLLKPFHPRGIIVGDDFRFGQNRSGTLALFMSAGQDHGFWVKSIHTQTKGDKRYSSTRVRELINQGALKKAAQILGRPVALYGRVEKGDQRGRALGFPTANVRPSGEILPPRGVYAVRVTLQEQSYPAVANVGVRPTFKQHEELIVEVHIFDFHRKIYDRDILIEFLHPIRSERFFPSKAALVSQIQRDIDASRAWFARRA